MDFIKVLNFQSISKVCVALFFLGLFTNTTLKAQDVVFYIDTVGYTVDGGDPQLYTIPVRVQNFTNISGAQVEVSSTAFPNAVIEGIIPSDDLPANSFNSSINGGGFAMSSIFLFLDMNGDGLTLVDDAAYFSLLVRIPDGISNTCVSFSFDLVDVVRADDPGTSVDFMSVSGVCLLDAIGISGIVTTSEGIPLENVRIQAVGQLMTLNDTTDAAGAYAISDLEIGGSYTVSGIQKLDEVDRADRISGINVADVVVIRRHILNLEPFSSPYQYIAADVNNDGGVSVADLVQLQAYILVKIDAFPNNDYWRFIPADYVFPDPNDPLGAPIPDAIELLNISGDLSNQSFIGVKIGDADFSAN